jgi:hypothetical protein
MRWIAALGLVVLALAPAVGAGVAPSVRVATTKPFVVNGKHFERGETVRVITQLRGRHVRIVKAGKKGAFTAKFLRLKVTNCSGFYVRAIGSKGSRAYVRRISDCVGG